MTYLLWILFPRWMAARKLRRGVCERAAELFIAERKRLGDTPELLAAYSEILKASPRLRIETARALMLERTIKNGASE